MYTLTSLVEPSDTLDLLPFHINVQAGFDNIGFNQRTDATSVCL